MKRDLGPADLLAIAIGATLTLIHYGVVMPIANDLMTRGL